MLAPKARVLIYGRLFTTEGYERAKVILKSKFGKPSEFAKVHMEKVISLPVINNSNPGRIHSFYEKLVTSVKSFESMSKLQNINGFVRRTLDKLYGIRSKLVRSDDDWAEWTYLDLVEAEKQNKTLTNRLRIIVRERSLINTVGKTNLNITLSETGSFIQGLPGSTIIKGCVYCEGDHRSAECQNISSTNERKKF